MLEIIQWIAVLCVAAIVIGFTVMILSVMYQVIKEEMNDEHH